MPNYENGKIYKLVAGGLTYVGSTTRTLAQRKAMHKCGFKRWKAGNGGKVTSYQLFESGEPVDIVLLEDFCCERKEQLHARERYWIEKLDCVNRFVPGRSKKEHYQDNKERISEYKKKWREQNEDRIRHWEKQYYEANKERQKKKTPCPVCSKEMRKDSIPRHLRRVHKND